MVRQRRRGREKGITQSTIVNMVNTSIGVRNVMVVPIVSMGKKSTVVRIVVVLAFVNMTNGTMTARNVEVDVIVNMGNKNGTAWNVTVLPFVRMELRNTIARFVVGGSIVSMVYINFHIYIVMVEGCAKPHIVLPEKVKSMMDTVCFALSICFRISLLHGTTRRRRTM